MRHDENHPHPRRRAAILLAAAGIVLLTAACGGSPAATGSGNSSSAGSSPGSPQATGSPQSRQLAFARCMRAHGITDFPDSGSPIQPSPGSDLNPDNPTYQAARQACRALQPVMHPDPSQAAQSLADALKFARCMREHGITNYPDPGPHSGPGGGPGIDLRGVDVHSPQFQAATGACRQYQSPNGKG